MRLFDLRHWFDLILIAFAAFDLFAVFFSLVYVIRLYLANLRELKFHKNTGGINSFMRFNLLFNSETKLYKNLLLIILLLIELFTYLLIVLLVTTVGISRKPFNSHFNVTSSIQCNGKTEKFHVNFLVNFVFHYQPIILILFFLAVLAVTGILVSSFLTTYLCRRYHRYSLDNHIRRKYVVWWYYQVVLLLLCCFPYLQVFFGIVLYILVTADLVIFFRESRRLVRIIKSVVDEIFHFEYDAVRYKQSYDSYIIYKIFIHFQFACFFVLNVLSLLSQTFYTFQYVTLLNCKINFLSYFKVEIPTEGFNSFYLVDTQLIEIVVVLYTFLNLLPWILYGCLCLTRYCTKQINILKYEKHLSS